MLACIVWGLWVWVEHFGKAPIPPCEFGDWEAQCCLCCCKMQDEHVGRCFLACWLSMVWMQRQPEPSKIITWGAVLCAWNYITSRTISPPPRAQSLGWFWDVLGVVAGEWFCMEQFWIQLVLEAPAAPDPARPHTLPVLEARRGCILCLVQGFLVPGVLWTENSDGGTSYLRGCVASPGGITFIWS